MNDTQYLTIRSGTSTSGSLNYDDPRNKTKRAWCGIGALVQMVQEYVGACDYDTVNTRTIPASKH